MKDEEIVALYWQRNEDAIQETSQKYGAYLTKIAHNVLSNPEDSEECVNDTYWKAWNSMPTHKPTVLSSYLGRITRQLAIDVFRKKRAVKRYTSEYALSLTELEEVISSGSGTEQDVDAELLADAINRFLHTLSADARPLFIGRYYFFDTVKDVAAYCGVAEGTAKSSLHRTRRRLKEFLQKEGYDL